MKFVRKAGLVAAAVALMLAGCGGGGGGGDASVAGGASGGVTGAGTGNTGGGGNAPQAPASLVITGTAATGDALAGATVTAKCAGGSGTATVGTDGRFSVSVSGGARPCVLEVPAAALNNVKLHGALVDGTVANVTPLTELALARLAGGSAASLFDDFEATARSRLSAASLGSSVEALRGALQGQVDVGSVDPFTVAFTINDSHDRQLDALMDRLTKARTTLAAVGDALAVSSDTPVAVATLLQPAAAGCSGLRTGRYRLVDPMGSDGNSGTLLQVDAQTLSVTLPGGTAPITLKDEGACNFTANGIRVLVAPSGVGVVLRSRFIAAPDISVVLPDQALPLSALAGAWNLLEHSLDEGKNTMSPGLSGFTLAPDGTITLTQECEGARCSKPTDVPPSIKLSAHAEGGFSLNVAGQGAEGRVFAFKTADGHVNLLLRLPGNTGLAVAARQQAAALPAVGTATRFWDFSVGEYGFMRSPAETSEVTVTATDPAAGTVTRRRTSDGRVDTQLYNQPLPGVRYRAPGSCTLNGALRSCDGTVALRLPGAGVTVYAGQPATGAPYLGVSIDQP